VLRAGQRPSPALGPRLAVAGRRLLADSFMMMMMMMMMMFAAAGAPVSHRCTVERNGATGSVQTESVVRTAAQQNCNS
jgi:hypothetical protein